MNQVQSAAVCRPVYPLTADKIIRGYELCESEQLTEAEKRMLKGVCQQLNNAYMRGKAGESAPEKLYDKWRELHPDDNTEFSEFWHLLDAAAIRAYETGREEAAM